jgi:hypothetical protein
VPDDVIDRLVGIIPRHRGPDLAKDRDVPQYDYISFMEKLMHGEEAGEAPAPAAAANGVGVVRQDRTVNGRSLSPAKKDAAMSPIREPVRLNGFH